MKERENIKQELKELNAEKLFEQFNENKDIPSNYFDNFSKNSLIAIKEKESKKTREIKFIKYLIPFSLVASILLLITITLNKAQKDNNWTQLSNKEIIQYIEQNIDEFSDEEIASISNISEKSFINIEFTDSELEEILLEMNIQEDELF